MHLDPTDLRIFSAYFIILNLNSETSTSRLMHSLKQFWGSEKQCPCTVTSLSCTLKHFCNSLSIGYIHCKGIPTETKPMQSVILQQLFFSKVTAMAWINKCMKITLTLPRTKAQWGWCSIYNQSLCLVHGKYTSREHKNRRITKAACLIPARLLTESLMSLPALPLYVPGKAAITTSETVTQGGGESYSSSFCQFCQAAYPLLHRLRFFLEVLSIKQKN